jgi:hypothetical protein
MFMFKKWSVFFLILGLFSLSTATIINGSQDPKQTYAKYLSVAEFEKITGLTGVITKHEYDLQFYDSTGKNHLLQVRFDQPKSFARETKNTSLWQPVEGIGEKAMWSIPAMPFNITFIRGTHMVALCTFTKPDSIETFLSFDQLKAVAKIIDANVIKLK